MSQAPFWKAKPLSEFNESEWESVCYRCGRCCLIKLQDDATNDIYYTNIICRYFDIKKHLCTQYKKRCSLVPECLKITAKNIDSLNWMPKMCAYRILNETGDLPDGHPLKGKPDIPKLPSVLISDSLIAEEDLEDYIIEDRIL